MNIINFIGSTIPAQHPTFRVINWRTIIFEKINNLQNWSKLKKIRIFNKLSNFRNSDIPNTCLKWCLNIINLENIKFWVFQYRLTKNTRNIEQKLSRYILYFLRFVKKILNYVLQDIFNRMRDLVTEKTRAK